MTLGVQEGKIMRRPRRVITKMGFWGESPLERSPTEGDASIPSPHPHRPRPYAAGYV
jgi:hypothetical protein